MKNQMMEALAELVQDTVDLGIKTTFTERQLNELGVKIRRVEFEPDQIQKVRAKTKLSQAVFAKVLNVSVSSVRQWEQGSRTPTGSTKVLLNLLSKQPKLINQLIKS